MTHLINKILSNEERASTIIIGGAVGIVVIGFVIAVGAIYFLK